MADKGNDTTMLNPLDDSGYSTDGWYYANDALNDTGRLNLAKLSQKPAAAANPPASDAEATDSADYSNDYADTGSMYALDSDDNDEAETTQVIPAGFDLSDESEEETTNVIAPVDGAAAPGSDAYDVAGNGGDDGNSSDIASYPSGDGSNSDGDNAAAAASAGKRKKAIWISVISVVVVAALAFGGWKWWQSASYDRALQNCQSASAALTKAGKAAQQAMTDAKSSANLTASEVVNGALITNLQQDLATAIPPVVSCDASLSASELASRASTMNTQASAMNALAKRTKSDAAALQKSQGQKSLDSMRTQLTATIATANSTLTSSQGKVADSGTLTTLQTQIASAQQVSQNSAATLQQLTDANTALTQAITAVNDSVAAQQQAELEARQKAYAEQQAKLRAQQEAQQKAQQEAQAQQQAQQKAQQNSQNSQSAQNSQQNQPAQKQN